MSQIVVIGAGMGGLAAAAELSARGEDVLVIEAHRDVGGKLGRAEVEGVEFDTGPSVLTMTDVARDLFEAAGTTLEGELELIAEDVFEYIWPDGMRLPVAFDARDTLANVDATLGAEEAREFEEFLDYAEGIWSAAAPNFVYGDAPTMGSAVKLGVTKFRELMKIDPMRSMASSIESRVSNQRLRDILLRYATYNGSDPRAAPATLNCIAWVELGLGCYGVKGGMFQLAEALARVAARNGAEFLMSTRVAAIEGKKRVEAVVTRDGKRIECDHVVCNADVAHLADTLMEGRSPVSATDEPSMSGWNAVIKAKRRDRPGHTVLFPERDYRQEFVDIFERDRPPEEPTVYMCAQEKAHRRAGWDEHEPLFVMANAPAEPARDSSDAQTWTELEEKVLQRLIEYDLINAGDEVVWRRTPKDLARQFPGSRGAIYGAASNSQFAAFQRPPNRISKFEGLYLASGSAHPGGGVPLCMLSGRAAARAIVED